MKPDPRRKLRLRHAGTLAALAIVLSVAGCGEQIIKHGYQFRDTDLQAIQPGMSQDQVRSTLGTPATTTMLGSGSAYYYISSTMTQTSFMLPDEKDRKVVAVYFNEGGTVQQVANYGLKDGKVFDFISAQTPAPGAKDEGILKSLFRNLGKKTNIFGDGT
ncbi:MAG: outer membrane protein assembly factor BamE [Hyphomicrobiaceae bacterium]|nr:outer membrane protein assembly factor BamE [Hyphomicrobiaceae bacterium]